jgi:chromate reductase
VRLLVLSGSLRADSHNRRLLDAAVRTLPDDVEIVDAPRLHDVPAFDEDREHELPASIGALNEAIRAADAVLIATPEYNASVPGHLKNALDWVSRPLATNTLRNKPVVVVGASTGAFGAVWAQAELRKVLAAIGARVVDAEVAVGHSPTRFDEDGRLADSGLEEELAETVDALVTEASERTLIGLTNIRS